ncbi:hypothetical protein H5R88_07610 [Limosilactobacillus sp. WF-MT5-A]|uniref:hypothetical protein n=1 Tax=Limosilactobacillus agrestis TaxID=2759748 RepID=UPI0015FC1292|nr:hypothetical protein [Limosilactobacillus agrestis]MBB1099962.1 hypothetical protein [Limosilactobacillus agrestis]MCD7127362.1 gp58-like family protein [Limosilactobacillus agrestis]
MLTQSKEVQAAWRATQRTLDIKVVVNGKTYKATDINSLKYDSGAYTGDTFSIGSTYSNSVEIEFSHLIEGLKLGMEVIPSLGVKTSSGFVYEPLGVFIISSEIKMDRNNNLTTINASDRFCGLEGAYQSRLNYPAKVVDVIAEICGQAGVKANTDDLARLPHQEDLPAPITGQTYRKALGWIAQLYAGYATFDRQGLFTIRTIAEPNYELDPGQYEQGGLTKNEAPYKINGIQCQVTVSTKTRDGEDTEETKTLQIGDVTGSQIKLENNIMTGARLNAIWEEIKDITFYPYSLNWFGNPAIEAGDWLRLTDKQGNSFVVPNNGYTLDFNGGLSATSKADQSSSTGQAIAWQGTVAQTISELKARKAPDGTVIFPPSVTEPPRNAKFNDVWFKKNGNATELWVFEKQDDGSGKWVRKDLADGEVLNQVKEAQQGLNQAKADIITNKQKADESLQKLNDSVANLQGQYDNNVVPNLNKVMADASDALQKYITAQNSIVDLTKQAQAQGKNIAEVTKTVDGLNINYANLAGDVNSTKVDVKGLQTTLGTANGDIAQLKLDAQNLQTMLAGKVDSTTYTNFVNLTNQALNARLTASDLNGYAKTADVQATANGLRIDLNSVTDRMNNLQIGGRNLIPNSGTDIVVESKTTDAWPAWKYQVVYWNLTPGETYTFSSSAVSTNGVGEASVRIFNEAVNKEVGNANFVFPADDKRHSKTFTIPDDGTSYSVYLYAGTMGKIEGKDFTTTYHHPMLQIGNAGTEWSPNPQDFQNDITQLSARITTNSQQFSSYYTKSETDNRTNSAKSDAVNAIKSDSNWQGLSNILTNSGFLQTADGFLQKVQQTTIPMFSGGGVNLVKDTSESEISGKAYDIKDYYFSEPLEPNTKYTISIDAKVDQEALNHQQFIFVDPYTANWSWSAQMSCVSAGLEYQHYRYTFITPDASQKVTNISVYLSHADSKTNENADDSSSGTGYFKKLKVERGEIDTPYSHAPSDNASQIAFSELSQSLDGLRSTVGSNYGNLQSQINQTATTLRGEVTDKVNGLQGQITTQANNINLMLGTAGDLSNICRNPTFDNHDGWTDSIHVESNWPEIPTKNCGVLFTRDGYYGKEFTVIPGGRYYTSVFANNQNDIDFVLGLHFKMKDGSDQWLGGSRIGAWECRQALGSITVPDNAVTAQIWVSIQKFDNFGFTRFTNVIVKKNDTLAQINMSAGTTLIQNDKIYMDASSTIFSGKAFIPDAAITNISADKITAGTLDAGRINVVNLNANNITSGTINGQNLRISLDTGEILFNRGKIASTSGALNIDIDNARMSVTDSFNSGFYFSNGRLDLTSGWSPADNDFKYGSVQLGDGNNINFLGMAVVGNQGLYLRTKDYDGGLYGLDPANNGSEIALQNGGRGAIIQSAGAVTILGGSTHKVLWDEQPFISIGKDQDGNRGNRIYMDADYIHISSAWRHTTGDAPNLFIANDGALVRSTSASKYKTEIQRDYSTDYGDRLLELPTATWIDKGQKERYQKGERHIKPNKYFGMIAEDLADAGLDLFVSRNPQTHEIEGIQYERIAPALIPVIRKLKKKVQQLEEQLNAK